MFVFLFQKSAIFQSTFYNSKLSQFSSFFKINCDVSSILHDRWLKYHTFHPPRENNISHTFFGREMLMDVERTCACMAVWPFERKEGRHRVSLSESNANRIGNMTEWCCVSFLLHAQLACSNEMQNIFNCIPCRVFRFIQQRGSGKINMFIILVKNTRIK